MRHDLLSRTHLVSILVVIAMTSTWQDIAPSIAQEPKKEIIPHAQDKPPNEPRDPQTAAKMMTVPEGFSVEVVAAEPDIVNPVAMTIDERGRFWITESLEYPRKSAGPGKDRVKILEDTDGDGKCDKFTVFLDGLNIPSGIAVGHGGVWIANSPDILFVPDADRDGVPDGPPQVVVTGFGRTDTHELPNSLTWGPDGWLYGLNGVFNYSNVTYPPDSPWLKKVEAERSRTRQSAGDGTKDADGSAARVLANAATPATEFKFTCAMFRIHPRTREFQIFAEGTSNPWGIAFNDEGEAFISACVIDHLWHIVETGYYHRQGGPYPPFTWKIESIVKHKHQKAAYCGIHYFDSDAYPEQYRGKLYMGNIHGGCINVDKLQRDGSTYFATGEPDCRASAACVWCCGTRRSAGWFRFATPGAGTQAHFAGELLKVRENVQMAHLSHQGAAPAVQTLLSGAVQFGAMGLPPAQPHVQSGAFKGLAITTTRRWPGLPDVPTMLELGYKDFVIEVNFLLLAPAKTPKEIVDRIAAETSTALQKPEMRQRLTAAGFDVTALGPAETRTKVTKDVGFWREIVAQTGIKVK